MPKNTELKQLLLETIQQKREKLSPSSAKTYISLLSTMFKNLGMKDIKELNNEKAVMEYVDKLESIQTKKTLLSAIFIITENDNIRKQMIYLANESNNKYKENSISEKRQKQYANINEDTIKEVYNNKLNALKKQPNANNYVQYIISAVCSGLLFPVRRLEWVYVKMKNFNAETDNYIDFKKKQFVFNIYKTFKTHGRQTVPIDAPLLKILRAWFKINDSDYMLIKPNGKVFSPSELSKELTQMFGCGVDILRSLYVNKVYGDALPKMAQLQDVANQMGHSINSAMTFYRKVD
jgi:hypothetical protein